MRRLFLPVLLFVLFTVFSARAGQPSYSADVTVDVTADNASAARELAMRRANRQAVSAADAKGEKIDGIMNANNTLAGNIQVNGVPTLILNGELLQTIDGGVIQDSIDELKK